MTQKQLYILGGVLVALVIAVGAYFFTRPDSSAVADALPPDTITASDRFIGSPTAKVTLIEYGALTCPHCAEFNDRIVPQLKEKYIDTGKVRYVFRLFPLDRSDAWGEKIARCLPADNYFTFVDLLFRNQAKWGPQQNFDQAQGAVNYNAVHEGLIQMGRIAGMSADKVNQCINDTKDDQRINTVAQEAITRYKLEGTPTLVINGVSQGANVPSWETLQKNIDAELAK